MKVEFLSIDIPTWDAMLATMPHAHLLQTEEWGALKKISGWSAQYLAWREPDGKPLALAMVLVRSLPAPWRLAGLRVMYIPKGPVLDWQNCSLRQQVMTDLAMIAKKAGAIFLKIDPDICLGTGVPGDVGAIEDPIGLQTIHELEERGWHFSEEQIQFKNTVILDLKPGKDTILAQMKQKTRYNIRLASRKGVAVRLGDEKDFDRLYTIYAETSLRDGFVIRDRNYYFLVWRTFFNSGALAPLVAEVDGEIVAGLMLFHFAGKAWYLHGMSAEDHREKMPNYLLQWEAIQHAIDLGCYEYDLWARQTNLMNGIRCGASSDLKMVLAGELCDILACGIYPFVRFFTGFIRNCYPVG